MPIAILQDGQIRPLEPLPTDWQNGQRLRVESIDHDFVLLANLCADSDPADEERLSQALLEANKLAKDQVCRGMKIPTLNPISID
jgi:hypothetical protein